MRRFCRVLRAAFLVWVLGATSALLFAAAAPGSTAADDVALSVGLQMSSSPNVTTSLRFQIFVEVASGSGVEQRFTLRIGLPAGLRWGTDAPDPSEGCTGTEPAVCTQQMQRNTAGTVGGGWVWDVVADRAGFYEITATVEPTEPDPDLSNNTSTLRLEVRPGTSGGGGGASVSASAVRLKPQRPKAGTVVAASVRVTAGGAPVRPTRLSCAGSIGAAKMAGTPRAAAGTATCLYRTPKNARGKTLRGTIAFTARGKRITRRFAAKLG